VANKTKANSRAKYSYADMIFDIFPRYPDEDISSDIVENIPKHESVIQTFVCPPGCYIKIIPKDVTCEALCVLKNKKGEHVKAEITITVQTAMKSLSTRVYHGHSDYHEPGSALSSVSKFRRWQVPATVCSGDIIKTSILADEKIDPKQSIVDNRVIAIEMPLPKCPKTSDMEIYTIMSKQPNSTISSAIRKNVRGVESDIFSFSIPTGFVLSLDTRDDRSYAKVVLRNKNGRIIKGVINVYAHNGLRRYQRRLYSSSCESHNPSHKYSAKDKMWSTNLKIGAGSKIFVRVYSEEIICPSKCNIELRVRVHKLFP